MRTIATAAALTLVLVLTGCGDDGDEVTDTADEVTDDVTDAADDAVDDAQDMADDMAEDLEDVQEAEGGGSAVLTIGDETWEFDSVLCAVGAEETGREDTPFVLSSIQDGLQLDATINTEFGHIVSLDDISDFENPSVGWSAGGPLAALTGGEAEEIIVVDGKDVSVTAEFVDNVDDTMGSAEGTLIATCP